MRVLAEFECDQGTVVKKSGDRKDQSGSDSRRIS
jgi:hypothetical protein